MAVYDCFMFNDEFDILDLRLRYLWDHVDYFVLSESNCDFHRNSKPVYFQEHRREFDWAAKKLIPLVCDLDRDLRAGPYNAMWDRENEQRNWLLKGLRDAHDDDMVMISDIDEIPSHLGMRQAIEQSTVREGKPVYIKMAMYWYYVNCRNEIDWYGTAVCSADYLRRTKIMPSLFRDSNRFIDYHQMLDLGGWHFTFRGSPEALSKKILISNHTECNTPKVADKAHIRKCIDEGRDLFGRPIKFTIVPLDDSFPPQLKEVKYQHLVKKLPDKKETKVDPYETIPKGTKPDAHAAEAWSDIAWGFRKINHHKGAYWAARNAIELGCDCADMWDAGGIGAYYQGMYDVAQLMFHNAWMRSNAPQMLENLRLSVEAHKESYGSFLPVFEKKQTDKPSDLCIRRILEFGIGLFSTRLFLNKDAFPLLESLVSYEPDGNWVKPCREWFKAELNGRWDLHQVDNIVVNRQDRDWLSTQPMFDLCFVDGLDRNSCVTIGLECAKIVVMHDAESEYFKEGASAAKHVFIYKEKMPWTTVMSNVVPDPMQYLATRQN